MGTPAYMAPEQAHDPATVDRRADIYAIGVLLFEALCGQRPFSGETLAELLGAHLYTEPEKPSAVHHRKGLPRRNIDWRQMDTIVRTALEKTPSQRFADCASLRQALAAAWGGRGPWADADRDGGSGVAASPAVGRRSAQRGLWLSGALLALVGLGGSWWLFGRRPAEPRAAAVAAAPGERAAALLQAALGGGVAERRALVTAVEMVRSRALLPYVEAALRDPAAAVWSAAVPVAAAMGTPADAALRELLAQRTTSVPPLLAVELAAARLRLGVPEAVAVLREAAAGPQLLPGLQATLALALAGSVPSAALQRVVARGASASSLPLPLRRAALVQLVRMGDAVTEKQLQQALAAGGSGAAQDAADEALAVYARAQRPGARARLAQAAQQASGARRLELTVALADAADAQAVALLLPLLRDATPRIRQRAAGALGSLGALAAAAAPALIALLEDPDPNVRLTASAALLAVTADSPRPTVAVEPSDSAAASDVAHARG